MTREEAKEIFINRGFIDGVYDGEKWRDACIVISKWLEQEPCEDAVNRAEIIQELNRLGRNAFKDDTDYDNFFAFVDSLSCQEPKSEWEQDHAILKAYSDGANEVLDKIRAEIIELDIFYDNDYFSNNKDPMFKCDDVLQIIDKYKAESEE